MAATIRLRRGSDGGNPDYYTLDGRFRVWHEPYHPHHWYINEQTVGGECDAVPPDGCGTLREARAYIAKHWPELV